MGQAPSNDAGGRDGRRNRRSKDSFYLVIGGPEIVYRGPGRGPLLFNIELPQQAQPEMIEHAETVVNRANVSAKQRVKLTREEVVIEALQEAALNAEAEAAHGGAHDRSPASIGRGEEVGAEGGSSSDSPTGMTLAGENTHLPVLSARDGGPLRQKADGSNAAPHRQPLQGPGSIGSPTLDAFGTAKGAAVDGVASGGVPATSLAAAGGQGSGGANAARPGSAFGNSRTDSARQKIGSRGSAGGRPVSAGGRGAAAAKANADGADAEPQDITLTDKLILQFLVDNQCDTPVTLDVFINVAFTYVPNAGVQLKSKNPKLSSKNGRGGGGGGGGATNTASSPGGGRGFGIDGGTVAVNVTDPTSCISAGLMQSEDHIIVGAVVGKQGAGIPVRAMTPVTLGQVQGAGQNAPGTNTGAGDDDGDSSDNEGNGAAGFFGGARRGGGGGGRRGRNRGDAMMDDEEMKSGHPDCLSDDRVRALGLPLMAHVVVQLSYTCPETKKEYRMFSAWNVEGDTSRGQEVLCGNVGQILQMGTEVFKLDDVFDFSEPVHPPGHGGGGGGGVGAATSDDPADGSPVPEGTGSPTAAAPGGGTGLDMVDDDDDDGQLCVVCLSEPRDTLIWPCRHLCVCAECGQALRGQSNQCPLCRKEITKLLTRGAKP